MLQIIPAADMESRDDKRFDIRVDDQSVGYLSFHYRGYILVIDELTPPVKDPLHMTPDEFTVMDLTIRALGSYGLNHSCFYAECENPALFTLLGQLRFCEQDGIMKSDLKKMLKPCGH